MVDEATEPGISDADGESRRVALVNMVLSGGEARYGAASGTSPGAAVAFAIRKRLKSEDYVAVLNTITLLDEVMRTCPYFFRYIANDKFFRRLWRFVDPEYKTAIRGKIPFVGKAASKSTAALRSSEVNVEIAERILILIRAWAEELSIMFRGTRDEDVGFFLERYTNKRLRIKFPEVPQTGTPWVCPVGPVPGSRFANYTGSGRGTISKTTSPLPKNLSIAEVENTVNLFSNMLEKASDISEVKSDVCGDLAERCRIISQNIDAMTATMEKEEDLTRAIRVSERLQKTLSTYEEVLATGVLSNDPPVVDGLSDDDSEDEGYDSSPSPRRAASTPHHPDSDHGEFYSRSRAREEFRDDLAIHDRAGSLGRSDSDETRLRRSSSVRDSRSFDDPRHLDERLRERPRQRKEKQGDSKKSEKRSGTDKPEKQQSKAKSRREGAANGSSKSKGSSSSKGTSSSKPPRTPAASADKLVDIGGSADAQSSSSEASSDRKDDAFGLLADRYTSSKPSRAAASQASSSAAGSNSGASTPVGAFQSMNLTGDAPQAQPQQQPQPPQQAYASQPGMPYGSVVVMPNPMAMSMYGSYGPSMMGMPQQGAPPLTNPYGTVNPAMYYGTVNPMAYGSVAPVQTPQQPAAPSPAGMPQAPPPTGAGSTPVQPAQPAPPAPVSGTAAFQTPSTATGQFPGMMAPQVAQAYSTGGAQSVAGSQVSSSPSTPVIDATNPPPAQVQMGAGAPGMAMPGFPGVAPGMYGSVTGHPAMMSPAMYSSVTGQMPLTAMAPVQAQQAAQPAPLGQAPQSPQAGQPQSPQVPDAQQQFPTVASQPAMTNPYGSVQGAAVPGVVPGAVNGQAVAYQNAMANAAAAYHAAASAYSSIQGQAPLQPAVPPADPSKNAAAGGSATEQS